MGKGNAGKAALHRARLREEAEERQAAYDKLTPTEKLARLKGRRGESRRERSRILKQQTKQAKKSGLTKEDRKHMTDAQLSSALEASERSRG